MCYCAHVVKIESLSKPITDAEGNATELGDTIADDGAIDLGAWLDARTFLLSFPSRLVLIAHKRLEGIPLDKNDQKCLERFRRHEQKRLLQYVAN